MALTRKAVNVEPPPCVAGLFSSCLLCSSCGRRSDHSGVTDQHCVAVVPCPNRCRGCRWHGQETHFRNHSVSCSFQLAQCSNCNCICCRKDLALHIQMSHCVVKDAEPAVAVQLQHISMMDTSHPVWIRVSTEEPTVQESSHLLGSELMEDHCSCRSKTLYVSVFESGRNDGKRLLRVVVFSGLPHLFEVRG